MWQANAVQLALFCLSVDGIDAQELFELGLGEDPETSQRSRTISQTNPFLSVASGMVADLQFVVQVQAGRIDVIVSPSQGAEVNLDAGIPTFECPPVLERLVRFVEAIMPKSLPIVRVALVVNLCKPEETYREAAEVIGSMLGMDVARDELSDLSFQVNRRKMLPSGQEMNRLVRLGVLAVQAFTFRNPQEGGPVPLSVNQIGVGLMLDFNTVPAAVAFSPAVQVELATHLKDEILLVGGADNPVRSILDNG